MSLKSTTKGKLKWTGDFASLQYFVSKNLEDFNGTWTTPRGGCKEFKTPSLLLRWYSNTHSLIFDGEEANNIQDKLFELAEHDGEPLDEYDTNDDLSNNSYMSGEEEVNKCPLFLEETMKVLESEMTKMYNEFKTNKEQTDNSLSELSAKVMSLSELQTKGRQDNSGVIEIIQNENSALKRENDLLKERIETLTFSLSALNNKIKTADQEKESLLTVIRLLNEDIKMKSHVGAQQTSKDSFSEVTQTRKKTSEKQGTAKAPANSTTPGDFNQFTVLPVYEASEDDVEVIEIENAAESSQGKSTTPPNVKAGRKQLHLRQDEQSCKHNNNNKDHQNRPNSNAAIVGDSMIKFIDARKLRNSTNMKIAVKTFPGAKTEDMMHYVKPTLNKQPSQLIIHVGTNDLTSKSPKDIVTSIAALGDAIKTQDPKIDLTFSEVITRNDEKALGDKVNLVNERLEKLCTQRNWGFINHKNIKNIHLNGSALHLNRQGSATLAKNIKTHLLYNSN